MYLTLILSHLDYSSIQSLAFVLKDLRTNLPVYFMPIKMTSACVARQEKSQAVRFRNPCM